MTDLVNTCKNWQNKPTERYRFAAFKTSDRERSVLDSRTDSTQEARPFTTEKLLMGRKESNQTNKQTNNTSDQDCWSLKNAQHI